MTDEEYQTLLEQVNANTQAIEEIKEVLAEMERVTALESGLSSCSCEEKWANLYNKDLAKFSLNGSTLNITLPNTEE